MINENKSQMVWSGLVWFVNDLFHLWSGLDGNAVAWGIGRNGLYRYLDGLRGCPWLSLPGCSLITRSVFGSGILKVHISLRSICCICIAVVTRYKTSPMRVTSIYTHVWISLFSVKQRSDALSTPPSNASRGFKTWEIHTPSSSPPALQGATVKKMLRPPFHLIVPKNSCQCNQQWQQVHISS